MIRKIPLVEGTFYHLYNRTNNQNENLFLSKDDYLSFLQRFRKYTDEYLIVYAYCLMPNHFHFLIQPKLATSEVVSKQLMKFFVAYAKWFNYKYKRRGSLFQNQFKAKPILDERYLKAVLDYIHENPLQANLVDTVDDWAYSSYFEYAEKRQGTLANTSLKEMYGLNASDFLYKKANLSKLDQNVWV